MVYILTTSIIAPGTETGSINGLWEDVFENDIRKAENAFNNLPLDRIHCRKELWAKERDGIRKLLKEERYHA